MPSSGRPWDLWSRAVVVGGSWEKGADVPFSGSVSDLTLNTHGCPADASFILQTALQRDTSPSTSVVLAIGRLGFKAPRICVRSPYRELWPTALARAWLPTARASFTHAQLARPGRRGARRRGVTRLPGSGSLEKQIRPTAAGRRQGPSCSNAGSRNVSRETSRRSPGPARRAYSHP